MEMSGRVEEFRSNRDSVRVLSIPFILFYFFILSAHYMVRVLTTVRFVFSFLRVVICFPDTEVDIMFRAPSHSPASD